MLTKNVEYCYYINNYLENIPIMTKGETFLQKIKSRYHRVIQNVKKHKSYGRHLE